MILRWVNQKTIYRGKLSEGWGGRERGLGQFTDLRGIGRGLGKKWGV